MDIEKIKKLNTLIAEADSLYGKLIAEPMLIKRASYKLGLLDACCESGQYVDTADIRKWLGSDLNEEHYNLGKQKFNSYEN